MSENESARDSLSRELPDASPGFAVRVLFHRGRRYADDIVFQPDPTDWFGMGAPVGGEVRILSREPIVAPPVGPALIIDRVVPSTFDDPRQWVDAATSGLIPDKWCVDEPLPVMSGAEFWTLIGELGGVVDDEGVARLVNVLSEAPFVDVVRFRRTLWQKLHDLDHPLNTIRTDGDHGRIIHADASLYYRCEIIARGESAFRDAIHDPRPGSGDDGADGEALLTVAEDAAAHNLGPIDTDIEIETGHNGAHWENAPQPDRPWEDLPSISPFSPEVLGPKERRLANPILQRVTFMSFVGYAVSTTGQIRELMGCLMGASFARAREETLAFLQAHLADDEVLDDRLRIWRSGAAGPMSSVALTGIERRSNLGIDDYIDLYINGTPPK